MPGDIKELEQFIEAHPVQTWFRAAGIAVLIFELFVALNLALAALFHYVVRGY